MGYIERRDGDDLLSRATKYISEAARKSRALAVNYRPRENSKKKIDNFREIISKNNGERL